VAVFTLYWVVVFNQTTANANGINLWFGVANAAAVVVMGFASDRLHVRRPFMLAGTLGTMAATLLLLGRTTHPATGYYTSALIVTLLGIAVGVVYPAWMANYTEMVEERNPALAATGLAIWGWVLRIVVAGSFLVMPYVITTSNPIVDNVQAATALQSLEAAQPYVPNLSGARVPLAPPAVVAQLRASGGRPEAALADILGAMRQGKSSIEAIQSLPPSLKSQAAALIFFTPLATAIQEGKPVTGAQIASIGHSSPQLAAYLVAEKKIVPAQKAAPKEWKRWWWVCLGGQMALFVTVFFMRGAWRPASARRQLAEHERVVELELDRLRAQALEEPVGV
jgi:MFS family permease